MPDEWDYRPAQAELERKGLDDFDWLRSLPPSQGQKYGDLLFDGVPLPYFMDQFIAAHYTNRKTAVEARTYILEATLLGSSL